MAARHRIIPTLCIRALATALLLLALSACSARHLLVQGMAGELAAQGQAMA